MKKRLLMIGLAAILSIGGIAGCGNKQIFDTTYIYKTAVLSLPDGEVIKGTVQSWTDYEDGDQIQVKINGKQYLVHSSNIVLISE